MTPAKYLLLTLCLMLPACTAQRPTLPTLNQSDPVQMQELNTEYWKHREANPELYQELDGLNDAVREGK